MSKKTKKEEVENKEAEEVTNQESQEQEEATEDTSAQKEETEENDTAQENENNSEAKENDVHEKLAALEDKHLRLSAEFDNFRKRTLKEKSDLIKSAGEGVLVNILPVVDDIERAIKSMDTAEDVDAVKEGVDLIYNKLLSFLKQNGIKEIEAKDCDFDTDLHEAVTKFPAPSEDMKGKVVDVVEKGYLLNEKVIRYSKVVVGE